MGAGRATAATRARWTRVRPATDPPRREIVNAILYTARAGCSWRQLPGDLPPWKRHIVVDTLGLLVVVLVTAASVQDRDGGGRVLDRATMAMPSLALVFADGGYAGRLGAWARRIPRILLEIVRKPEGQRGFAVLPRRWVVERTLSWLTARTGVWPATTNASPSTPRPGSSGS